MQTKYSTTDNKGEQPNLHVAVLFPSQTWSRTLPTYEYYVKLWYQIDTKFSRIYLVYIESSKLKTMPDDSSSKNLQNIWLHSHHFKIIYEEDSSLKTIVAVMNC